MTTRITILIFLWTIAPLLLFGQLRGEYCHQFDYGVDCIKFLHNNHFQYRHFHCTGEYEGQGFYELTGSKLVLKFQSDPTKPNRGYIKMTDTKSYSDSIEVDILVMDLESKEPLINTDILINDSKNKRLKRLVTDLDGIGKMRFPISSDTLNFFVTYIGYRTLSFSIIPARDHKISILLEYGFQFETGDIEIVEVRNIGKSTIDLKNLLFSEFETYSKKLRINKRGMIKKRAD